MLEFIVLGQIPGTNLYISFSELSISISIILATAFVGGFISSYRHKLKLVKAKISIETQTI